VHVVLVEPGDFQSEINAKRRIFTSKESAYQTAFEKLLQRRLEMKPPRQRRNPSPS